MANKALYSLRLAVLWLVPHLDPNGSAGVPAVPATISVSALLSQGVTFLTINKLGLDCAEIG